MKCLVCNLEFNDDIAKCPRCGFPVLGVGDNSPETHEQIRQKANEYRIKKWSDASIYLDVYKNSFNGAKVVSAAERILLGNARDLTEGSIKWYNENFARQSGDCILQVYATADVLPAGSYVLKAANPSVADYWNIGLMRTGPNKYRLAVGTPNKYSTTAEFSYPPDVE